jgi:hypothetical protein
MLNIKAKNKLSFNKIMIEYYDSNDIEKATLWLYKYYQRQISELH